MKKSVFILSSVCSDVKYEEIRRKRLISSLDSTQKFLHLLIEGFRGRDLDVNCVSLIPVSHSTYPGFLIKSENEKSSNIHYHYVSFLNYPFLKSISGYYSMRRVLSRLVIDANKQGREICVIVDALLLEASKASRCVSRKQGVRRIGLLTDMPQFADLFDHHSSIKKHFYKQYNYQCNKELREFDGYVFLAEAMNSQVNGIGNKPWMLLECVVEGDAMKQETKDDEHPPRVLYAGKIHEEFGMDLLMDAIPKVKSKCVFDFYGDGNAVGKLKELALKDRRVSYHGIVSVSEVMKAEANCSLLINPRKSEGEFTKYSFPSKTAEYMVSGTPVLMFRLPGIPSEYYPYLFFSDEETPDAFASAIDRILCLPKTELMKKGEIARSFVLANKSNTIQADRLISFMDRFV